MSSSACIASRVIRVHDFGGPDVLKPESFELPSVLEPDQLLIAVAAFGINPVETYIRSGTYARTPTLPYTPGTDCAGVVVDKGSAVADFAIGDRVFTTSSVSGAYGEHTIVAVSGVHPLPESVTVAQGAAIGVPYYTAHRAITKTRVLSGETVLVHGATGAVGSAAIQMLARLGCVVIASGGSSEGLSTLAGTAGVQHVVDHSKGSEEQVMSVTKGRGVDVVLEMLANVNLGADLRMLAMGGRVAVIGNRGDVTINPRELMKREAQVVGVALALATAAERRVADTYIYTGLMEGWLRPLVGATFSGLDTVSDAHVEVMERRTGLVGKVVVLLSGDAAADKSADTAVEGEEL